jgi:hypothetical protein
MLFGGASGGSGSYSYHWEPANLLQNANIPQPVTVNLTETTLFYLTVTDYQTGCVCEAPDAVVVNITGTALVATPSVLPDLICSGEAAQLFALAAGGTENYSYSWTSSPPGFTSIEANPYVTPYATTTYTVNVSDGYNSASGSITLNVNPSPSINLGVDETVCVFDTLTLDAGNPGSSYLWSNGSTDRTITVGTSGIGFDIGTYSVTVTSPQGCEGHAQKTIIFDFGACSGIGEETEGALRIYPNPGNGVFQVENSGKPGDYFLSVTDAYGTKVIDNRPVRFHEGYNSISFDLRGYPAGIYMVRITGEGHESIAAKYFLAK